MKTSREEIKARYLALRAKPLGELVKPEVIEEIKALSEASEWRVVLGNLAGGFDIGFLESLEIFSREAKTDSDLADFFINTLLEQSAAVTPLAPSLNLGGLCLTTLPYTRPPPSQKPYLYQNLNFRGAKLYPAAAITAVRGGGDITQIDWHHIIPNEKEKFLQLQQLVTEARTFLGEGKLNPRGVQELFDRIIDADKPIFQIMNELRDHVVARRGSCLARYCCCWYGRDASVQRFYQKWANELQTIQVNEERQSLLPRRP